MTGVLGIMAKSPVPGQVKTRLAQTHGDGFAAEFASACLQDTWAQFHCAPGVTTRLVLAGQARPPLTPPPVVWPQATGDLGQRMELALQQGLAAGDFAILIGTDSPGLTHQHISQAISSLDAYDAVFGPTDDGGFYLVGLRRCSDGLFSGLPWSSPETLRATEAKLSSQGYRCGRLSSWFDVDDAASLERLRRELQAGTIQAPACKALLDTQPVALLKPTKPT